MGCNPTALADELGSVRSGSVTSFTKRPNTQRNQSCPKWRYALWIYLDQRLNLKSGTDVSLGSNQRAFLRGGHLDSLLGQLAVTRGFLFDGVTGFPAQCTNDNSDEATPSRNPDPTKLP
jgi:hypothetical protein